MMYLNEDIGTDIDWTLNNGDVSLVSDETNLITSICRRINTNIEETFYDEYGCDLEQYLGWKKNDVTLSFIQNTINDTITQDPRVAEFETELSYIVEGIKLKINLYYKEDETLEFSLIIDNADLIYQDEEGE